MKNNPDVNIRTDFAIDEIVKPRHMNALAASAQYDYVVTEEMIQKAIEAGVTEIDVDELLGGHKIASRAGEYSVLINALVDSGRTLVFYASDVGGPSGILRVHVYALGPYTAKVAGMDPRVTFYFHTRGEKGAVTLTGIGCHTYVGSFNMTEVVQAPVDATFFYEMALGELPDATQHRLTIKQKPWMSNSIGNGSGTGVIRVCSFADKNGNITHLASKSTEPLDSGTGLDSSKALDLSEAVTVDWVTWSVRGKVGTGDNVYFPTTNPKQNLYLDTKTMIEGVVYEINIACYCDGHVTSPDVEGGEVSGGLKVTREPDSFFVGYCFGGDAVGKETSLKPSALPLVQNGSTCNVTISYTSGRPSHFEISGALSPLSCDVSWNANYNYPQTPNRTNCTIAATPGHIVIDLGKPTGYSGEARESLLFSSNISLTAGNIDSVTWSTVTMDASLRIVADASCLWTPSATEAVQELKPRLYEGVGTSAYPSASGMTSAPAYIGSIYLMKLGEKVYVLSY